MVPFTNFVVKIHELCNINCTYCYMYNLEDKSFLGRPKRMTESVRDQLFLRLAEHVKEYELGDIVVFLHGGEPLLCGKKYVEEWIISLRRRIPLPCNVIVIAQTNATLLDEEWIDLFHRHGVRLGVSLDGPREHHDRYRITKKGAGTFDRVMEKLALLREHPLGPEVFGSILSVANPDIDPRQLWTTWTSTGFSRFDINLPHGSHDNLPWFTQRDLSRWLIELFDIWWTNNDAKVDIRFFRNILHLLLGAQSATDYIGGTQVGILVLETDGSLTGTDALRACDDGLIGTGMDVFENKIQDPMALKLVRDCNYGAGVLSSACLACEVKDVCGGGYYPHRYRRSNYFDNPSIYCEALFSIIHHIRSTVIADSGSLFERKAA